MFNQRIWFVISKILIKTTIDYEYCSYLACRRCDNEVCIHIFFTELLGNVETQRSIVIVDVPFRLIAQDCVSSVDLFKLKKRKVVWIILGFVIVLSCLMITSTRNCDLLDRLRSDCRGSCRDGTWVRVFGMFFWSLQVLKSFAGPEFDTRSRQTC